MACKMNVDCDFIVGLIFYLPIRDYSVDVVWSSGVIEHYRINEQQKSINESLRVLKKAGRLIVIVPNKKAVVYNISRMLSMKIGKWKFGYEEPLSPREFYCFQPKPITCYSIGFLHQFRFITLPIIGFLLNDILNLIYKLCPSLKKLDKRVPGYLLGALWIKNDICDAT